MGRIITTGRFGGAGAITASRSAGTSGDRTDLSRRDIVRTFASHQMKGVRLEDFAPRQDDYGMMTLLICAQFLTERGEKAIAALAPVLHILKFKEGDEFLSPDEVYREIMGSTTAKKAFAPYREINPSLSRQQNLAHCLRNAKVAAADELKHRFLNHERVDSAVRTAAHLAAIAIVLDPEENETFLTLGTALADTDAEENLNVAASCFRAVLERDSSCAEAYTGLAFVSYKRAWTQGKEEKFKRVMEIAREAEEKGVLGPVLQTMRFVAYLTTLTRAYVKNLEARTGGDSAEIAVLTERFQAEARLAEKDIEPVVAAYRNQRAQYNVRTGLTEFLKSCLFWENHAVHDKKARESMLEIFVDDPHNPDRLTLLFFMRSRQGVSNAG